MTNDEQHYDAVLTGLGLVGFEISPAGNTISILGREVPVELVMDLGLPAILEQHTVPRPIRLLRPAREENNPA